VVNVFNLLTDLFLLLLPVPVVLRLRANTRRKSESPHFSPPKSTTFSIHSPFFNGF
jgi:hypothetical protein